MLKSSLATVLAPLTGDNTSVWPFILIGVAVILVAVILVVNNKKNNN